MTYIVGIQNKDTSYIICDSRVSQSATSGTNYSLKSGLLFSGCIYAGCGYTEPMRRFINNVKTYLTGTYTYIEFWEKFNAFFQAYDHFSLDQPFQLLLASRHSGSSNLYLLDTRSLSITKQENLVTLGSGKALLDPVISDIFEKDHLEILETIKNLGGPPWFYGYFYCFKLMEYVQGADYDLMNRERVGGFFHFSYQTSELEHRQHPAAYVLVKTFPPSKNIQYTIYRVTFEKMALVIENGSENSCTVSIDSAAYPAIQNINGDELQKLHTEIVEGSLAQPYYNFCGIGFADNDLRGNELIFFNLGNNDYVIDRNTINDEIITSMVNQMVSGELAKKLQDQLDND